METHSSPLHLQWVYYIQWQNEVERQFLGEGSITLWSSGTEETYDSFSLNINILGKIAVLHLVHFCSWGCANSSMQFIGHN
jgi:hypothetical protein